MRFLILLLLSGTTLATQAQQAFRDSLSLLCGQVVGRLTAAGHSSVAVAGITPESVSLRPLGERLANELTYGLVAQGNGVRVVEREALGLLLEEQRLGASGLVNGNGTLTLGELVQAEALLSGTLAAVDKKRVRLELKLLNTTTGVVDGMWRMVIPAPAPVKEEALATLPATNTNAPTGASAWRFTIGAVGAHYFGQKQGGMLVDLAYGGGDDQPALTLGLRFQWLPLGGTVPQKVGFGLLTAPSMGLPLGDLGSVAQPGNGDVYLVPLNDLSYGASLLGALMAAGVSDGGWKQVRATGAHADRFSLMLPLRLYLARGTVRPFLEAGLGLDLVLSRNTYEVTDMAFTRNMQGGYSINAHLYPAQDVAYEGAKRTFSTSQMLLGAGLEIGRLGLWAGMTQALNKDALGLAAGKEVHGDPMGIALLNGSGLEDSRVLGELAQAGALPIGNTGQDEWTATAPRMSRFLSHTAWQVGLTFRFG